MKFISLLGINLLVDIETELATLNCLYPEFYVPHNRPIGKFSPQYLIERTISQLTKGIDNKSPSSFTYTQHVCLKASSKAIDRLIQRLPDRYCPNCFSSSHIEKYSELKSICCDCQSISEFIDITGLKEKLTEVNYQIETLLAGFEHCCMKKII